MNVLVVVSTDVGAWRQVRFTEINNLVVRLIEITKDTYKCLRSLAALDVINRCNV